MINLPVVHKLDIDGYGLFPGTDSKPGLHTRFTSGLKLILGANGLGKTTLVTVLFRMLAGPSDIPNLDSGEDLGSRRLEARPIARGERRIFAERVSDGAADASATLSFYLGETRIEVSRSLKTLEMLALTVNGEETEVGDAIFEQLVQESAGVSSFGDWILALRYLVFYFEDRRALIWDPSAQRQLLRLLFLPPAEAAEWTRREREILELDSAVRNRRYVLRREESSIARAEGLLETAGEVRQQLNLLQRIQEDETEQLDVLNDGLVTIAALRETARINALTAEQAHESAVRSLERLQLHEIEAAFPDATEVGKYIIGQILAEEKCLTCGSDVPEFANEIRERISRQECPVCGSTIDTDEGHRSGAKRDHSRAQKLVEDLEVQVLAATEERAAAEKEFDDQLNEVSRLNAKTATRSAEIRDLLRRLPPDEREVHQQRSELATAYGRLEQDQAELRALRQQFQEFVLVVNEEIAQQKEVIKTAFDQYAEGFLFEDCALLWSPKKSRIGQEGDLMEYAAFEMDMTGSDFQISHRRTGPEQVSESQREFIDLSFRMALMDIASESGGTLVIDAPESSLDAVFATRAAEVLTRFCTSDNNNRLIVTSNLVDGDLVPALLKGAEIRSSRDSRIIDLLRIATPTAAIRRLHDEYIKVRQNLFRRARAVDE
jgi:hypothetical protein